MHRCKRAAEDERYSGIGYGNAKAEVSLPVQQHMEFQPATVC
jgi:hypothetical protein